jgi:hypothetical protein
VYLKYLDGRKSKLSIEKGIWEDEEGSVEEHEEDK